MVHRGHDYLFDDSVFEDGETLTATFSRDATITATRETNTASFDILNSMYPIVITSTNAILPYNEKVLLR